MSRLVRASGSVKEVADGAGILSNLGSVGLYAALLALAGLPKSDSPLGLFFIGDHDLVYLCDCLRLFS